MIRVVEFGELDFIGPMPWVVWVGGDPLYTVTIKVEPHMGRDEARFGGAEVRFGDEDVRW